VKHFMRFEAAATVHGPAGPNLKSSSGPAESEGGERGRLLNGPILSELLKLAAPTVVVLVVQTLVSVTETYFVGHLGTNALAGVSLVFSVLMLMTMMSNGGIGGGVASAIARALGGGRIDRHCGSTE
jgi:Na+-driven multidrug efflux pump